MGVLGKTYPVKFHHNARAERQRPFGERQRRVLNREGFERAQAEISAWPGYAPTRLYELPALAKAAGVAEIWYKDESTRFGLGSFKALGGAYAVLRLLAKKVAEKTGARDITGRDLAQGRFREITSGITVCCATDGNHGRSVAWGAQQFGCKCVIYIHATVSEGRKRAIERYGAEVVRCAGTYDDSVRRIAEDAAARGWYVVSDTSYEGYMDVPRDVMQGYSVMAEEALVQLAGARPTHVFIPGGVGGFAAAVAAQFWERLGAERPRLVVVEPDKAACLYESARAGKPVAVEGDLDTIMAGLACGEVSLLAWEILDEGADDFLAVPDEAAAECMRLLAEGNGGDPRIVAGESAVAGLAGALAALAEPRLAAALDLEADSRLLFFGSEGATDEEVYVKLVGRSPKEVLAA